MAGNESNSSNEPTPWETLARGRQTAFPAAATLPEIFREWVQRQPGAVAVIDGDRCFAYAELEAWSDQIADRLRERGVLPSARIGVPAVRSAEFVAAILGILKIGATYLPVDLDEPPARRALRAKDCHYELEWPPPRGRGDFPLPDVAGVVRPFKPLVISSENPAYVLYTSGSTGKPKGVVVPHRAISRLVCATDYLQVTPDDRFALHSNLSFDASTLELWAPLLNGASLVVTPRETLFSAETLGEHLRKTGITSLWLTTSLFAQLAQQAPAMFASLRHLIFGGEAANLAAVRSVWTAGRPQHFINGYGPTETTTFAVCHAITGEEGDRIPIGRPIANTDAWVLDEAGEPAEEGALWIGGPGVALGYLHDPEMTEQSFVETHFGRLYRTGDRARWRPEGTLEFLGRADRQIKIRGFRIEPGEVEAAIMATQGVKQCAVRVLPGTGEARLAAYVVGNVPPHMLRIYLKMRLPEQMIPTAYAFLDKLPLTANGKLDERALPQATVLASKSPPALAGTPLQRKIAEAWGSVLSLESVGLDDNFFDVGGTSLSVLRLHGELRALSPDRMLRVVELFKHTTVRKQAKFLESEPAVQSASSAVERAARRREAMSRRKTT